MGLQKAYKKKTGAELLLVPGQDELAEFKPQEWRSSTGQHANQADALEQQVDTAKIKLQELGVGRNTDWAQPVEPASKHPVQCCRDVIRQPPHTWMPTYFEMLAFAALIAGLIGTAFSV